MSTNSAQRDGLHHPMWVTLFCHFSFWFGLLFASPVFVGIHNQEAISISLPTLALIGTMAFVMAGLVSWKIASRLGARTAFWTMRVLLALSIIMAIQGNFVHDLFNYGAFNGQSVNFRSYGWKYWLEFFAWASVLALLIWWFGKTRKISPWLPAFSVASFLFLLLPALPEAFGEAPATDTDEVINPSAFAFSSIGNLVHLLPDGLQGDVVRQVLRENPPLAEKFKGFTLFTDNVGVHQGTAPAMQTMQTGNAFDLNAGFNYQWAMADLRENAYQKRLLEAGYQVDYVPISGFMCLEGANSCIVRPFNDMKARGFYRHKGRDFAYSLRLVADLSLFRLVPMLLKERVYNDGKWFFADTTLDGSSPWPDPVIREWTENMYVIDDRPVYKWHHNLGTHIPAKWDADCRMLDDPSKDRAAYLGQAKCVLTGLGRFLDRLDELGVYDQTAMIISGDHGHNVAADDVTAPPLNSALYPGVLATGRPALLVKRKNLRDPLAYSDLPTSVMDIAATAMDLAGLEDIRRSVFEIPAEQDRDRLFRQYSATDYFTGQAIPYVEYTVGQPANDGTQWSISDIRTNEAVPTAYDPVNRSNAKGFVYGARLRKSLGNNKSAWITGRQLAFIISLPEESAARGLDLSLHIPEWMPEQSFRYRFNRNEYRESIQLVSRQAFWQTVTIPWPVAEQLPGQNFVSIVFDRLYTPPDVEAMQTPALIRSIKVADATGDPSAK